VLHGHLSPYGHASPPRLAEWADVVREFGAYYGLAGAGPIAVDPALWRAVASRFGAVAAAEPGAAPDRGRLECFGVPGLSCSSGR
jgi:hypothetical protein